MMKMKFTGTVLFLVFFIVIFNAGSDGQTRRSTTFNRPSSENIYIEGHVYYRLDHRNNYLSADVTIGNVRLKKDSLYRITGIKFNGQDVPKRDAGHYYNFFVPFNCFIGKILEIKVGIKKKGLRLSPVRYVTVGKYKVKNYIKKYIFPVPNSVINLSDYEDRIPFKWAFAATPERMELRIIPEGIHTPALSESTRGRGYNVPVNVLTSHTNYSIHLDSSNKNFLLTAAASPKSKLTFSHHCTLYFKTL